MAKSWRYCSAAWEMRAATWGSAVSTMKLGPWKRAPIDTISKAASKAGRIRRASMLLEISCYRLFAKRSLVGMPNTMVSVIENGLKIKLGLRRIFFGDWRADEE